MGSKNDNASFKTIFPFERCHVAFFYNNNFIAYNLQSEAVN